MKKSKKLIIVGPPAVGKTTIKKVFFEMFNPYELLKKSLKPTRGINSSVYSFFNIDLGVFDLAGQEINDWFTSERKIFNNSDVIISVIDINVYLKEILDFLEKLIKVYNEMNLSKCSIVVLAHKIDLIDKLYLQHKIKAIKDFFSNMKNLEIKIYQTSIEKEYFLKTYDIICRIITELVSQKSFLAIRNKIDTFRNDIKIILNYKIQKQYHIDDLIYDLNLSNKEATLCLERLEHLGFVEYFEDLKKFQLTDKAMFFKSSFNQEKIDEKNTKINKILENLYYFSNLNYRG